MSHETLNILILEDNPADAELMEDVLRHSGLTFSSRRVETRADFLAALDRFNPDLILSDYQLPSFNGLEALQLLRQQQPHLPFVFVTGAMGEDAAVETLRQGANDYILKDRLQRLPEAVRRALEDAKVRQDRELASTVFEACDQGVFITDVAGTILKINPAFTDITGFKSEDVLGRNVRLLSSGRHSPAFYGAIWEALAEVGRWSGEIWNRRKDGEVFAALLTISALRDGRDKPQQYVGLFSDITGMKMHQSHLEHIAHYDALTKLPNRLLLADRMQQAMAQALRRQQKLAVVYLDLDGFKAINDSFGHQTGDHTLITLANRFKEALREGDTIARIGGDEFVAVLTDLEDSADGVPLLKRLLAAATQAVEVGPNRVALSASLGITFYPQAQEIEADQLLRQADQAMYGAKLAGKNRYVVFGADGGV